jgi:hypothetical protein
VDEILHLNVLAPGVWNALMTQPALQRLYKGEFMSRTRTCAISIDDRGGVIAPTFLPKDSNRTETLPADTVVFVSRNRPNRDL